jgi:hypothetical protein
VGSLCADERGFASFDERLDALSAVGGPEELGDVGSELMECGDVTVGASALG